MGPDPWKGVSYFFFITDSWLLPFLVDKNLVKVNDIFCILFLCCVTFLQLSNDYLNTDHTKKFFYFFWTFQVWMWGSCWFLSGLGMVERESVSYSLLLVVFKSVFVLFNFPISVLGLINEVPGIPNARYEWREVSFSCFNVIKKTYMEGHSRNWIKLRTVFEALVRLEYDTVDDLC